MSLMLILLTFYNFKIILNTLTQSKITLTQYIKIFCVRGLQIKMKIRNI